VDPACLARCEESREEVDSLVAKALAAGGSTCDEPEDFGFMYTHSFVDPGWSRVETSPHERHAGTVGDAAPLASCARAHSLP
jgi:hypothetical protein